MNYYCGLSNLYTIYKTHVSHNNYNVNIFFHEKENIKVLEGTKNEGNLIHMKKHLWVNGILFWDRYGLITAILKQTIHGGEYKKHNKIGV
ncbi:hypothetical protein ACJX0J_013630, partial [Zea mays]